MGESYVDVSVLGLSLTEGLQMEQGTYRAT